MDFAKALELMMKYAPVFLAILAEFNKKKAGRNASPEAIKELTEEQQQAAVEFAAKF